MYMKDAILAWSGGKDSANCLYKVTKEGLYDIKAILTTVTEDYDRISMHGVRRELLELQSRSINIPLEIVYIPADSSQATYEISMEKVLSKYKARGVGDVIFGDIFLEDIRQYRLKNLSKIGLNAIFPLWGSDTGSISREFVKNGFEAVISCVDLEVLDKDFAGRVYNNQFLRDLPNGVDPCGENGEFHSFVYKGPVFHRNIEVVVQKEKRIVENRFCYCDIKIGTPDSSFGT